MDLTGAADFTYLIAKEWGKSEMAKQKSRFALGISPFGTSLRLNLI